MNGWKMLHSKHGRVLPPDKRDGKRKRETEVEGGGGRAARMEGRGGKKWGEGLRAFSGYKETEGGTERRS